MALDPDTVVDRVAEKSEFVKEPLLLLGEIICVINVVK